MTAYTVPQAATTFPGPQRAAQGEAARDLAAAFLRYASACWRGEERARWFATRLGAYWRPQLPATPTRPADAFSPHGAGGHGIAWYQTGDEVFGHIPGRGCGYQVPVAAIPQLLGCVAVGQCNPRPGPLGALRTVAKGRVIGAAA